MVKILLTICSILYIMIIQKLIKVKFKEAAYARLYCSEGGGTANT